MFRQARSFVLIPLFILTVTRPLTGLASNFTNDIELQLNVSSDPPVVQIQVDNPIVSSTNVLSLSEEFQTLKDIQVSPTSSSSSSRHSVSVSSLTTKTKPPNNTAPSSLAPSSLALAVVPAPTSSLLHSKVLVSILSTTTTLSFVTDFKGAYSVPSPVATLSLNPTVLNNAGSNIQTSSSPPTNSGDVNASGASFSPDPGMITGKLPPSINHAKDPLITPRGNLHLGIQYALAGCALSLVL